MKSKRSLIRAILFVLRLQKNVNVRRNESRRNTIFASRNIVRCESTKHRRRSSHKCSQRHRNSAPSSSYPLRSPSVLRSSVFDSHGHQNENGCDFGAFSAMSQPYLVGLDDSRGRPLLSVCAGAAHTLASTALLCRQQRHWKKVASGPLMRGVSVQRQSSIELLERRKTEDGNRLQKKAIKTNMISMYGALLAVEQNDKEALNVVLDKNQIDVNAPISSGSYEKYSTNWTLLDVAINLNHAECVYLLQQHNAIENHQMNTLEKRKRAIREAVLYTTQEIGVLKKAGHSKENDKHLNAMNAHIHILKRMEDTLECDIRPTPPICAIVEATSKARAIIRITLADNVQDVVLRYKVEWSVYPNFEKVFGECIETRTLNDVLTINGLENGMSFIFRVSSIGAIGESEPKICSPGMIEISSWDDDHKKEGWQEKVEQMKELTAEVMKHRSSLVWQRIFPISENTGKRKKNGLKELFTASSKFSKHASRFSTF
ncbi:unnamed protein product [Caenorhabditis angaria]|uniref:Fibronectin type-III domain-containing protein n=1 Tax=Caenorhabditis angaria TaxID=860376 RepID=A0A9P1NAP3_9PELO|nr:unnamed protein product [Caenorhabditis angaria]